MKKAFTLAEVLIALVIIGVVAAITISNIVTVYEKRKTVEQLKIGYSILSNAVNKSIFDNGPLSDWYYGDGQIMGTAGYDFFNKYLAPYLNVTKYCGGNAKGNSSCKGLETGDGYQAWILQNGMGIMVRTDTSANWKEIQIDINGIKKPNKMGRDRFVFYLRKGNKSLKPYEPSSFGNGQFNCVKNYQGTVPKWQNWSCAYKIMHDDWQIKDDYPW